MKSLVETLQPLGRALMLPIAVLPIAALLLRLGQPDLFDIAFISAAGAAIFDHLGLLFAIGVAVGFARDGNGAACLAGVTCFLVSTEGARIFLEVPPDVIEGMSEEVAAMASDAWRDGQISRLEVPIGIISGLIGGNFYNRFSGVALPEYLAFFGGRRFVPIATGLAGLVLALAIGLGFPAISAGFDALSRAIVDSGGFGLFLYGALNRLLIVTGLHHIINNVAWFVVGEHAGVTGDLRRFFAGDPQAGAFMAGFFPVMMFGLPAACLAMYHEARSDRKKAVAGMLFSLAFTSFLTGITEPIEFSFMFLAPILYLVHTVLTGISMTLMDALGVKLGFGFSAGLFDYVLNFNLASRPLMLLPVGAAYFLLYYGIFRLFIRRFNLPTPGRERELVGMAAPAAAPDQGAGRGGAFVAALGGAGTLRQVEACTTRLRLMVADQDQVDEAALKRLGARGVLRPSANAMQVVLGPIADMVAVDIRDAMGTSAQTKESETPVRRQEADLPPPIIAALGGRSNIAEATALHGRLRIGLVDSAAVDLQALESSASRGFAMIGDAVHLLVQPSSSAPPAEPAG